MFETQSIWITGAGGLIGNYLAQSATAFFPERRIVALTRDALDLEDSSAVRARFDQDPPSLVVHCAAMSKSPACQASPALARKLNVDVTALLAELSADIPFVFLSTDMVFDGLRGNYGESAFVNPLSIYAETKVAAEKIVLANPGHTVIRTSLNGGASPTGDRGFNEEMRRAWREGRTLNLFTDEFRSPIAAEVTARAIWQLAGQGASGIFHVAGAERLSRWEIGQLLAARCPELRPKSQAGSLKDYQGAPRAPDTSLDCAKAQKLLGFKLPSLRTWLAENPEKVF